MKALWTIPVFCAGLAVAGNAAADRALNFRVALSGDQEVPNPVATDATGTAILHVNRARTEIRFKLDVDNAVGILAVAGAHLHCAPAGANGPIAAFLAGAAPPNGFDGEVQVRATLGDQNVINVGCGADIAGLVDAMLAGDVYVNVHSAGNPGGEIRGQVE